MRRTRENAEVHLRRVYGATHQYEAACSRAAIAAWMEREREMARRARKAMFMVLLRGGIGIRVTRPRGRWYRF
jgi:hypothetical protein